MAVFPVAGSRDVYNRHILLTTYIQYNATYFATYTESGVRRITLAERLRKIPLSFFGKKDLADLTSTIMADCTFLEQSFSHFIPELAGSIISTILISISPVSYTHLFSKQFPLGSR